jgi:hypothetical protein
MPTIEETKQSINQFSHYLSELNDEGFVNLDNEKQVKFFLDFLSLFKTDQSQITIYVYQCIEIDVGDYDYETGHHTYQVCGSHEGYLIVLGDHDEMRSLIAVVYLTLTIGKWKTIQTLLSLMGVSNDYNTYNDRS